MSQVTPKQAMQIALAHAQAGRLQQAETICRQVLGIQPDQHEALHLLGVIAGQMSRGDIAIELLRKAVAAAPGMARYHFNLAVLLQERNQLDEAIASYRKVVELNPRVVEAHNNLGNALKLDGKLDDAIASYQRAIEAKGDYADAHNNLGAAWSDKGEPDKAIASYRRAIAIQSDSGESHANLGAALLAKGEIDDAIAALDRAAAIHPQLASVHLHLGSAWRTKKQNDKAAACYERALQADPDLLDARLALADIRQGSCQYDAAIEGYQKVLEVKPRHVNANVSLGAAYFATGQIDAAIACFRKALDVDPDCVAAHDQLLCALANDPRSDGQSLYVESRHWNAQHAQALQSFIVAHDNDRDPNRPLRVGYVVANHPDHGTLAQLRPLIRYHVRAQFEPVVYRGPSTDPEEVSARDTSELSDEQLAACIHADRIDILVDLHQHVPGNRLLALARKPAPIQITGFASAVTTGLTAIDYRITDPWIDPPEFDEIGYSERSIRLPETICCFEPLFPNHKPAPAPASQNNFITFACLNARGTASETMLTLWADVLKNTSHSRLILHVPGLKSRRGVVDFFADESIPLDRVEFVECLPRSKSLIVLDRVDIALDTCPCNDTFASADALWAGVPVITLVGTSAAGRTGLSLLSNVGLPELIAHTPGQYVQIATDLANDRPRLVHLRSTLRRRLQDSPLMDAPRFVRVLEAAYRTAWQTWCARTSG